MAKNNYWLKREQKWIKERRNRDITIRSEIRRHYKELEKSLGDEIKQFYATYANQTGMKMSDAVRAVNDFDVKSFEKTAKKMVEQKDFSPYANDRLRTYNATMKINRLEYLKSKIGLDLIDYTSRSNYDFYKELTDNYWDEVKRQSGILGRHSNVQLKQSMDTIINASFHGASWSQRLWVAQDELKAKLDTLLTRSMIQGVNPKKLTRYVLSGVSKEIKNSTAVAERLMITETARVQDQLQTKMFKDNNIEYVKWVAEPTACDICLEIAAENDGVYKINKAPEIPIHPRCRCSKSAWLGEVKNKNQYFEQDDFKQYFSDDERQEMSDILSKAPKPMQDLWDKYSDGMRISGYDNTDGSYFLPATGTVQLNIKSVKGIDGNEWRAKYNTVFHEFGHYMDYVSQSYVGRFTSSTGSNSLSRLLQRDWDNLLDKQIAKGVDEKDFKKYDMVPNKVFYGGTQFSLTKKGKLTKASREKYSTIKLRNELLDEMRADKKGMADVSDMIQAVSGQNLGVGHDKNYYNGFNNPNQGTEAFAEMYSATVSNPESLAKIKKYFPTAYDRFLEDVDWIIKEGAEYHGPI